MIQTGIGACRATDLWRTAMSDIRTPAYFYDKTGVWRTLGAKTGVPLRAVHGLDGVKPPVIKILWYLEERDLDFWSQFKS